MLCKITTKYMGIKKGKGGDNKNFATEVLKIELSGPKRSYFSIIDIPGAFSYPLTVNDNEMRGVENMIEQYMKQPGNVVV
jgi:hypothetical protein